MKDPSGGQKDRGLKAIHGVNGAWNTCQKNRKPGEQP